MIAVHGFTSGKTCATYRLLLRRLPTAGYGMIEIVLPGHGKEESRQETEICSVEDFVRQVKNGQMRPFSREKAEVLS